MATPEGNEQPERWQVGRMVKTPAPGVDRTPPPRTIREIPDGTTPKILPGNRIR